MSEYLPCIVAVVLIRESLTAEDRAMLTSAARRYAELRETHAQLIASIESHRGRPDHGLRIAMTRGDAAAEIVARIFEGGLPTVEDTYILGEHRPDFIIATALQHVYDLLEPLERLRFKKRVRVVVKHAVEPLAEEVAYILRLLDSWEAWELEQQLM